VEAQERRAYVAGGVKVIGDSGYEVIDPMIDFVVSGCRVSTTAWLAGEGDLLVLDWRQEATGASLEHDAEVLVRDEAGFTAIPMSLPRVHAVTLEERFVLRRGEALVLVQALPDRDDLQLTIVTWDRDPIP
jgi:hypothetical protein